MSLKNLEQSFPSDSRKYTLGEYFEFESKAEKKHEFFNGEIVKCAYTSENHGRIVSNLVKLLGSCLELTDCDVFTSDRMVFTANCNRIFYPDVTIVCDKREYYQYSKNMKATINPSILVEVVSDSTVGIDRGDKLRCYRTLQSLKQYIIIEQDYKNVEIYERDENGRWSSKIMEEENDVLKIGVCEISMDDLYLKVEIIEPNSTSD